MAAVKARIWKDRETGRWCYDVRGPMARCTGDRATWPGALAEAVAEMRWLAAHPPSPAAAAQTLTGWPATVTA